MTGADDIDLRPILGVIARAWQSIHPLDLTADEVMSLMTILMEITNRLDPPEPLLGDLSRHAGAQLVAAIESRPVLRLVKTETATTAKGTP